MAVSMLSHWSTHQLNCLRLALGVSFSLVVALLLAWPGSFLMAIITSMLLSSGAPPLGVKQGLGVMLATFGLLTFGQLFTEYTLDIPIVCTLFIVLFIILGQYAALSGTSTLLVVIWFINLITQSISHIFDFFNNLKLQQILYGKSEHFLPCLESFNNSINLILHI